MKIGVATKDWVAVSGHAGQASGAGCSMIWRSTV